MEADRLALGITHKKPRILGDEVWIFECQLRKAEFYKNCKRGKIWEIFYKFALIKLYILSLILGFTIPLNVFGPGLAIVHRGTIVVSNYAKVGSNCRIHADVNIGLKAGSLNKAPRIGNNVYIGPGAKLFGDIEIADNIAIGANSVVNRSFSMPGQSIAGVPAQKISNNGSEGLIIKGAKIIIKNNCLKMSKHD